MVRLSISSGSTEFDIERLALTKKLKTKGIKPGEDGCWSIKEMAAAIFDDHHTEKLRKMVADADKAELETAKMRQELISTELVAEFLGYYSMVLKQELLSHDNITEEEKDRILEVMQEKINVPAVLEYVQSRASR